MTGSLAEPNHELAVQLLAGGCDERTLRRFAGFASLRAARGFMNEVEVQQAVAQLIRQRCQRIGAKALQKLEAIIDDPNVEARSAVAACRTALEASGALRRDVLPPTKHLRELSVSELNQLIAETEGRLVELTRKAN